MGQESFEHDQAEEEASCKRHLKTLQKPFELDMLLQLVVELLISGAEERL